MISNSHINILPGDCGDPGAGELGPECSGEYPLSDLAGDKLLLSALKRLLSSAKIKKKDHYPTILVYISHHSSKHTLKIKFQSNIIQFSAFLKSIPLLSLE